MLCRIVQLAPPKMCSLGGMFRGIGGWFTEVLVIWNEIQVSLLPYFCLFGKYTQSLDCLGRKSRVTQLHGSCDLGHGNHVNYYPEHEFLLNLFFKWKS